MTDMQPQKPEYNAGLEQLPLPPTPDSAAGEHVPTLPSPESGITTGAERREQTAELQAAASDAARSSAPAQTAAPVAPDPVVAVQPATPSSTGGPLVADDADLIEKEWVERAKKIILETKDDPFARTNRVNELQKDYLQKRYNKNLGA
jgi:hypothetical protein